MLILGSLLWRTTGAGTVPPPPPLPAGIGYFFGGKFFEGGFFGNLPPAVTGGGGYIRYGPDYYKKSKKRLREERELFGIPDEVKEAIALVAKQQAERLELDAQKQLDELRGELKLRNLEIETGYLEALANERERLIDQEIDRRIQLVIRDNRDLEDLKVMILLVVQAV